MAAISHLTGVHGCVLSLGALMPELILWGTYRKKDGHNEIFFLRGKDNLYIIIFSTELIFILYGYGRKSLKEATRVICQMSWWRLGVTFWETGWWVDRISTTNSGNRKFVTCCLAVHHKPLIVLSRKRHRHSHPHLQPTRIRFRSVGGFVSTS